MIAANKNTIALATYDVLDLIELVYVLSGRTMCTIQGTFSSERLCALFRETGFPHEVEVMPKVFFVQERFYFCGARDGRMRLCLKNLVKGMLRIIGPT